MEAVCQCRPYGCNKPFFLQFVNTISALKFECSPGIKCAWFFKEFLRNISSIKLKIKQEKKGLSERE